MRSFSRLIGYIKPGESVNGSIKGTGVMLVFYVAKKVELRDCFRRSRVVANATWL